MGKYRILEMKNKLLSGIFFIFLAILLAWWNRFDYLSLGNNAVLKIDKLTGKSYVAGSYARHWLEIKKLPGAEEFLDSKDNKSTGAYDDLLTEVKKTPSIFDDIVNGDFESDYKKHGAKKH